MQSAKAKGTFIIGRWEEIPAHNLLRDVSMLVVCLLSSFVVLVNQPWYLLYYILYTILSWISYFLGYWGIVLVNIFNKTILP